MNMLRQRSSSSHIHRAAVASALAGLALQLSVGCARLGTPAGKASAPSGAVGRKQESALLALGQYRPTLVYGLGYATYEVYLTNLGKGPLAITGVALNDQPLWKDPLPDVVWYQCYPSTDIAPGQTVVFQICFRSTPLKRQKLEFRDFTEGRTLVSVPPWRLPKRYVTAITYSKDYRRLFVQVQGTGIAPMDLRVNGRSAKNLQRLTAGNGASSLDLFAFDAPVKIRTGMPLHVRVMYHDGESCQAMVRAMSGILLDAYAATGMAPPAELGLDADPAVSLIAKAGHGDVACEDLKAGGKDGFHAPVAAEERLNAFRRDSARLSAIHYCTGVYTALWAIYGGVPDALFVNPYSFGHGGDVAHFIENDIAYIRRGRESIRPRPFFYTPETCLRGNRFLEAPELQVLVWSAFLEGAKGLKYFHYNIETGGRKEGMESSPRLYTGVRDLDAQLRTRADILSMLVPVSTGQVPAGQGKAAVTQAWAGDVGMLILVRNLNYTTDGSDDQADKAPRFVVQAVDDLSLRVELPPWLKCREAVDFLTGDAICRIAAGAALADLPVGHLAAFRLVWLPNGSAHPVSDARMDRTDHNKPKTPR